MRFDRICPCNQRRKNMSWNQSLESKPAMWAMRCVRKGSKSPSQRGLSLPEAASDGGRGVCVALLSGRKARTHAQANRLPQTDLRLPKSTIVPYRSLYLAPVNLTCN